MLVRTTQAAPNAALRECGFKGDSRTLALAGRAGIPAPCEVSDVHYYGAIKRTLDVLIAVSVLVVLAPLILIVMALIAITNGYPVFFAQDRVGRNGRTFRCYKFRTMRTNGDEVLRRHLKEDPRAAREWKEKQKLNKDPRVSPFGNILRKSSIDELPQLVNVIRGDMSCVGPRPVTAGELPRYGLWARECFSVRPGLTGIWQVSGRSTTTYARRVALDRFYARKWSLWLDFSILSRSIPAILHFDETA